MGSIILKDGDSGPAVRDIAQRLVRLGLLSETPVQGEPVEREYFDTQLADAVRIFQQSRGLTVDGVVGPQTLRRLEEARWALGDRILRFIPRGIVHGDDVVHLQRQLIGFGFAMDRVDGIYGPQTENAVREFQKNVGLGIDGICGPDVFKSLSRLNRTVAGGSQEYLRELVRWDPSHSSRSVETCTILLDPSDSDVELHGGSTLTQANVCWDIASRLEGRLAASGAMVVVTRSQNSPLGDERTRALIANQQNVDLVLSLNMDANPVSIANGLATYYFGHEYSRSATGMRLAGIIQDEIITKTPFTDAHTHAKTWDILRLTKMPSIRTTIGYSSNPQDATFLSDPNSRDLIADCLSSAVSRIMAPKIG
jgi:N-acetylmuramoyl-L-alanine amidase